MADGTIQSIYEIGNGREDRGWSISKLSNGGFLAFGCTRSRSILFETLFIFGNEKGEIVEVKLLPYSFHSCLDDSVVSSLGNNELLVLGF